MIMEAIARPLDGVSKERAVEQVMNGIRSIVRALRLETRAIERELGISLAQLWVSRAWRVGRPWYVQSGPISGPE
jgi:hypothetical protein